MPTTLSTNEEAQLLQTIEMFEVITQSQPHDYQSLEILKEAYSKLGRQADVIGTSKRIAEAYVQLGQLSSAILEYESILQQYPNDPDVQKALGEIENRANSFTAPQALPEADLVEKAPVKPQPGQPAAKALEVDDGRAAMQKIFVDGKLVSPSDFEANWPKPSLTESPGKVIEPFIYSIADKNLLPIEQSLKVLCDKARLGYLPIEKYDVDVELARSFPKDVCQRWCVIPLDRMSKSVLVATANPFNKQAARDLEGATKYRLLWYLAQPVELMKVIKKVYR